MKAAQFKTYGPPSVMEVVEIDTPKPGADQVLVAVQASSINPFDVSVRRGYMKDKITLDLPITLGGDIAGVVSEVGSNVSGFKPGDLVYGQANAVAGNSGAFAEYAVTKPQQLSKAPASISIEEVASLPLVGASALQGLSEYITLSPGKRVFIHGGGGGIGAIAVQVAKQRKAYVATTATGDDIAYVQSLGADEVIDFKSQDFSEILKDFDAVFDTVGGEEFNKTFKILKPNGVAVSMAAGADQAEASKAQVSAFSQSTRVTTGLLDTLRELVEANVVKPRVAKVFPIDQIVDAFTYQESGNNKGKVVIKIS